MLKLLHSALKSLTSMSNLSVAPHDIENEFRLGAMTLFTSSSLFSNPATCCILAGV